MNVLDLRSIVTDALAGKIGTYTFASTGETTPAILVDDGAQRWVEEPKPSGLEIVIQQSPKVTIGWLLGGYTQTVAYAIYLSQWDLTKTTLDEMLLVVEALRNIPTLAIGNPVRSMRAQYDDLVETMLIPVSETIATYVDE